MLSALRGTLLSLFGMEIDVADYAPAGPGNGTTLGSSKQFLTSALRTSTKLEKVDLPATLAECETYASWYFRSLNCFTPVLHKPDFMAVVSYTSIDNIKLCADPRLAIEDIQ